MNGWLILEIALGVVLGELVWAGLRVLAKPREHGRELIPDEELEDDWEFLWGNVPESAKDGIQATVQDEELFRRVRSLNLWPHLWQAAPENIKEQMRGRWKHLKMQPRWKS